MTGQDVVNALSTISLLQWLIFAIISIVGNVLGWLAFTRFLLRRQWKFYQHLKRPIVVLQPVDATGKIIANMENELQLLKGNGFLNISTRYGDYRSFDPSGNHCIVVLGYKSGMVGLDDLLARMKTQHVPLIVYTYGVSIIGDDRGKFDSYPWTMLANFPLTLLNHIFATAASYPYEKRRS